MDTITFFLAFGFTNLAMLGWLAAAAAPLLIHLWSRHRFREAPWAAMQFLLAAMRKNARRMQLQQWLLLAVRTLIIVLVVLAVAEPYGEPLLAGGSSTPTHHVLVFDGSYSMAYRDEGPSRFERARQLAAAMVRLGRPADTFTVILMSKPARTILDRDVIDHAAVAAQIEALTQPHSGADLAGALSLVQEALSAKSKNRDAPERHEVYFFTDLQRSTWAEQEDKVQSAIRNPKSEISIHDRISELSRRAPLNVIDVGQPQAANSAVTELSSPGAFTTVNRDIAFELALRHFGPDPRPQCAVELLVDGVPVGEQTVDLPAGGDAAVRFTHRFHSTGGHIVSVRAAGDGLSLDDVRSMVVPVREEVRVLCVAGREGAAKYVANALNPSQAGDSPIRPIVVSEGDLAELELSDFDCIFMCNVAQLTSNEAERLRRYAANGRGVVFFLGDRVVPESYNSLADGSQSLLPARLSELISAPQFGLDPLGYRHAIVAPFRGQERAGLLTTPVARYYRLDVSGSRMDAQLAVALPNGDPFIVAAPLGRGRIAMVATDGSLASVDPATGEPWTAWPTWPSYLPIVRELLAYAASGQQYQWQQPVGTPLVGTLPVAPRAESLSSTFKMIRPDGEADAISIQTTPAGLEWSYAATDVGGIYSLRGLPGGALHDFAVNVDTVESDLAKADPQELPSELAVRDTWQRTADDGAHTQAAKAGWSASLLWAGLALLFLESFLAWQFGRGAI